MSVGEGERRALSLAYTCKEVAVLALLGASADARLERTIEWWRGWSQQIVYDGDYRDAVGAQRADAQTLEFRVIGRHRRGTDHLAS